MLTDNQLSPADLAAQLRADLELAAKATAPPWRVERVANEMGETLYVTHLFVEPSVAGLWAPPGMVDRQADGDFIAASRERWPAVADLALGLLAENEALARERDAHRKRADDWADHVKTLRCPKCHHVPGRIGVPAGLAEDGYRPVWVCPCACHEDPEALRAERDAAQKRFEDIVGAVAEKEMKNDELRAEIRLLRGEIAVQDGREQAAIVAAYPSLAAERDRLDASETELIGERDRMEEVIAITHLAIGGDGEWVTRIPEPSPPDSGDLCRDVPELAGRLAAENERLSVNLDGANGCLAMIRDFLRAVGCGCPPETHDATPPMMYPEWIAHAMRAYAAKERELRGQEIERLRAMLADCWEVLRCAAIPDNRVTKAAAALLREHGQLKDAT